jgi:membrane protein
MKPSKSWRNDAGNLCVMPPQLSYWELGISLGSIILLLGALILDLRYTKGEHMLMLIPVALGSLFFLYSFRRHEQANILRAFKGDLDHLVAKTLKEYPAKTFEVRRKVYMPRGYKNRSRYILILLSNGVILEYTCASHINEGEEHLELLPHGAEAKNSERIECIKLGVIGRLIKGVGLNQKEQLFVELSSSLVATTLASIGYIYLSFSLAYLAIALITTYLSISLYIQIYKKKQVHPVIDYFTLPPILIARFILPGWIIFISYILLLLPYLGLFGLCFLCLHLTGVIKEETLVFLILLTTSTLPILFPRATERLLRLNPLSNDTGDHQSQSYMKRLAVCITQPKAFNCVVSFLYLAYLLSSNLVFFESGQRLFSESIDNSVLQAFLGYIAVYALTNDVKNSGVTSEQLSPIMDGFHKLGEAKDEGSCSPNKEETEAKPLEKGEGELGKADGASTLGQERSEAEEKQPLHSEQEEIIG